jgi:uncharacterized protein YkwD
VRPTSKGLVSVLAALVVAGGGCSLALAATGTHHRSGRHRRHSHVRHHRRRHRGHSAWCRGAGLVPKPGNLARVRAATICLINRERVRHHEARLKLSLRLALAAQRHSESMALGGYFAHDGPRGETPLSRISATGYLAAHASYAIGENIGWGTLWLGTPRAIVAAWMASPGHRANILFGRYRETAIGVAFLRRGRQPGGVYTEDFGALGGHGRSQHSS